MRIWAFWRRVQYGTGFSLFALLILGGFYYSFIYVAPACFDGVKNGSEKGVDCGGTCTRICSFEVEAPRVSWVESFKIQDGQYNTVAYVENKNNREGTPELRYTMRLFDDQGLITERSGASAFPPGGISPFFEGRVMTGERVPTRTEIELFPHDAVWLPREGDRTSFEVSNRKLTSADSKPVLMASLSNLSVREVGSTEVVAVIFNAAKKPLTASETFIEDFGGRSTVPLVFTWPSPIARTVRSCEVPTDVVLAIDLSGSMNNDGGSPPEPITSVLRAAEAFVTRLNENDQVGLVRYATEAEALESLTKEKKRVSEVVHALAISAEDETGSTNTGEAIRKAGDVLISSLHNPDARKVLVLLSDGLANAPDENPEEYAYTAADTLKKTGVEIYTIGLGGDVNDAFLTRIASDRSHYLKAASRETVDTVYRSITSALCEEGAAVIDIIPKSSATFAPLR